jgi:Leucine-rich repeat (LRR) protein
VLAALPPQIGQLALLQSLTLTNNHLTSLPNTIGNLDNLTELWLDNNLLHDMPAQTMDTDSLQVLILWNNELSGLSSTFRAWADSTVPGWEVPIRVLSPNGGETWHVGDTVYIEWVASRMVTCVEFALRLDTSATLHAPIAPANRCRDYLDDDWGRTEYVVPDRLFDDTLASHRCVLVAFSFVFPVYRDSSDSQFTLLSLPQAARDPPPKATAKAATSMQAVPDPHQDWTFDLRGRRLPGTVCQAHGLLLRRSPTGNTSLRPHVTWR